MARHVRTIASLFARQARRADRVLRAPGSRRGRWRWAIPLGGFVLCASALLVAGIVSGVSALEYIPIAFFEALVIGGLFVVCTSPPADPPESDDGGRGPGDDPTSAPPPFDPALWVSMLRGSDTVKERDVPSRPTRQKERVGARR
ncbi:MAG TPA: hypothetical protein VMU65_15515 [Candidatus Saccharimonadales bacterium]|nr:hypothetical protein [Candidatus Saccharimonadales bacterium]